MDVVAYRPDEGGGWRGWQILLAAIAVVVASVPLILALWVGLGFLFAEGDTAKREQAKVEMIEVGKALNVYAVSNSGVYPGNLNPIRAAFGSPMPVDPFTGADYVYTRTAMGFELRCLGRDGLPGGTGADEDLVVTHLGYGNGP